MVGNAACDLGGACIAATERRDGGDSVRQAPRSEGGFAVRISAKHRKRWSVFVLLEYRNATSWNTEIQHAIRLHIALLAVRGIWSRPYHLTPPESDVRIRHMDSLPAGTEDLSVSVGGKTGEYGCSTVVLTSQKGPILKSSKPKQDELLACALWIVRGLGKAQSRAQQHGHSVASADPPDARGHAFACGPRVGGGDEST